MNDNGVDRIQRIQKNPVFQDLYIKLQNATGRTKRRMGTLYIKNWMDGYDNW